MARRRTNRWTGAADPVGIKWNADWRPPGQLQRFLRAGPDVVRPEGFLLMRFSTRQFLVFVTCVGAWLGLAARGHHLLGWWGLFAFGVPFGAALLLLFHVLVRWHDTSFADRVLVSLGILVGISCGTFVSCVALQNGLNSQREEMREISRLEFALRQDQRFRSVLISCEGVAAGRCVLVRGAVPSQEDLDDLHLWVDKVKVQWPVYYQVEVEGE